MLTTRASFPILIATTALSACSGASDDAMSGFGTAGATTGAGTGGVNNASGATSSSATGGIATAGVAGGGAGAGGIAPSGGTGGVSGGSGTSSGGTGASTTSGSGGVGGMVSGGGAGGTAGNAGGAAAGNAGTGTSGGMMIEPSLGTVKEVTMYLCAGADCHGGNEFNPLDLRPNDDLYMNLVTGVSEKCDNLPIVDPGNPEGSALVRLLNGPCGEIQRMPAGCFENEFEDNCVPDDYIAAIEQWVANGAPPE